MQADGIGATGFSTVLSLVSAGCGQRGGGGAGRTRRIVERIGSRSPGSTARTHDAALVDVVWESGAALVDRHSSRLGATRQWITVVRSAGRRGARHG